MKRFLFHILFFGFFLTANAQKIVEANALQYVSEDSLIIEIRLKLLASAPLSLGAANFSLYFNSDALDIQNATFDVASPWEASQNPTDYLATDIKKLNNFFVVNTLPITSSTGSGSPVDTTFTRLARIAIPITDASQTSDLAWRTLPIAVLDWDENIITPQVLFTLNTTSMTLCSSPETPVLTFSGNSAQTVEICQGSSVTMRMDSSVANEYEVYKNGQLVMQITQDSFVVTEAGEYFVIAKNYACASDTSQKLYVNVINPLTQPQIVKQGDTLFCANCQGQGIKNYQWYFNGQPVGNGSFITNLQSGLYTLEISNTCGNKISEVFDNIATKTTLVLNGTGEVTLFPNPAFDNFYIKTSLKKSAFLEYKIYDEHGKFIMEVFSGKAQTGTSLRPVDASKLSSGMYFLKVKVNQNPEQTLKFIIAR